MTDEVSISPVTATPDRKAIRAQLEQTGKGYHDLLNSLTAEDWKRRSGNRAWSVGQLMWHLAWGAGYFPRAIEQCRKGKASNPPPWIMHPANVLITRIGSRKATPQTVAEKYDVAHAAILACLDGVKDDEWSKGVRSFGQYITIESAFQRFRGHFEEHEADIRKGLGRA